MITEFKLTTAEIHSGAWMRIKAHLEERLELHRKSNDSNLTQDETARLRGRIAATLYVLSLGVEDLPESVAGNDE
jgi:hypothetical protein